MLTVENLKRALANANNCDQSEATTPQELHQARSSAWVRCLGEEFKQLYAREPDIRVFHKWDPENRTAFGLNELLYDVCVCRTAECDSATQRKKLCYVTKALWQVESEFARDSFEAVKDFNKLVIGAADNKLFVGPRLSSTTRENDYLNALLPVAHCCAGEVYTALVSHPDSWAHDVPNVAVWRRCHTEWRPI
jgi:hypothetical protein